MAERVPRAVIFGCAGPGLSPEERRFLADAEPLGFILFRRNVRDRAQVGQLVASLREAVGRADAPVLVDQEGGRVQRLGPPHWRAIAPARRIGEFAERNGRPAGERLARAHGRLIGHELVALGIDVDCLPVADVPVAGAHDIIGDRAFSRDPGLVAALARALALGLMDAGCLPVVKHMPGHGRARVDSHVALPVVECGLDELAASDFKAFKPLADLPWGMVAHVLFTAIDDRNPASTSPIVVRDIIRGLIGFQGLLVSDDLSMRALGGTLAERAERCLAAGLDAVVHCTGDLKEMSGLAAAMPRMTEQAMERWRRGLVHRQQRLSPAMVADAERDIAPISAAA